MNYTIVAPAYLPTTEYFMPLVNIDSVLYATHLQYVKRSSINRSALLKNNKHLTIPVKHDGINTISNKKIAHIESWQKVHLRTIKHLYGTLPFFDDYFKELEETYYLITNSLAGFLHSQFQFFLDKLKLDILIYDITGERVKKNLEETIIEFTSKTEYNNIYFLDVYKVNGWLDPDRISQKNIKVISVSKIKENSIFRQPILSFLFQFGPEAPFILRNVYQSCFMLR